MSAPQVKALLGHSQIIVCQSQQSIADSSESAAAGWLGVGVWVVACLVWMSCVVR